MPSRAARFRPTPVAWATSSAPQAQAKKPFSYKASPALASHRLFHTVDPRAFRTLRSPGVCTVGDVRDLSLGRRSPPPCESRRAPDRSGALPGDLLAGENQPWRVPFIAIEPN